MTTGRRGVYPGSFNPPTVAHLAIADAARHQHRLDEVVWVVSEAALAKENVDRPVLRHRLEVLEAVAETIPWLRIEVTTAQLLADIAVGFDLVVMGADKWQQISLDEMPGTLEALKELALAPSTDAE